MTAPIVPPEDPPPPGVGRRPEASRASRRRVHGGPIPSESLFAGADEVQIEHRGALYRLKQTALGKLILTK